jgi:nicotinate dehydrogenase subunit A
LPAPITLHVNGQAHALAVAPGVPLLQVLRNDLGLNGPKYGCGLGECGACAVLVDGIAARSCSIPVEGVAGRAVTTLEGLGVLDAPHPVQQAFIDTQAAQCGYCLNGMLIATVTLLRRTPQPTDAQARTALQHHLCRCGSHLEILAAVQRAAVLTAEAARVAAAAPAGDTPA